jgi:hypothetical protein
LVGIVEELFFLELGAGDDSEGVEGVDELERVFDLFEVEHANGLFKWKDTGID